MKAVEKEKPLTAALPPDAAGVARAVADNGCAAVATRLFGYEGAAADRWQEAWKNPQTGRWTVERYRLRGVGEGRTRTRETVLKDVCFFDAVASCARFEAALSARDSMADCGPLPDAVHFRGAAEAAGIPFDADGLPHPAAYGRVLTDGEFDDRACAIAARSKEKTIVPVPETGGGMELALVPGVDRSLNLATVQDRLDEVAGRIRIRQDAARLADAADSMVTAFARAVDRQFSGPGVFYGLGPASCDTPLPLMATLFTAGLYYPVHCALERAHRRSAVGADFFSLKSKFDRLAGKLPESAEKETCLHFSKSAAAAFYLAHAACLYRKCDRDLASPKNLKKGLKLVDRAAREAGEDETRTEDMKHRYLNGELADPGRFYNMTYDNLWRLRGVLNP